MNPELIQLLAGAVLPPFIDLVNSKVASPAWRYAIALLASLVVGAILTFGDWDWQDILKSASIVFIAAQTVYQTYWKRSEPRTKLQERLQ